MNGTFIASQCEKTVGTKRDRAEQHAKSRKGLFGIEFFREKFENKANDPVLIIRKKIGSEIASFDALLRILCVWLPRRAPGQAGRARGPFPKNSSFCLRF